MKTNIPTKEQVQRTGTYSGEGSFSEVYILPDGKAVKVCKHANADAWLWWAAHCMFKYAHGEEDSFMPRIDGIRIDVQSNQYIAVMEGLEEAHDEGQCVLSDAILDEYAAQESTIFEAVAEAMDDTDLATIYDMDEEYNWMVRGGDEVVATDPICYNGWHTIQGRKTCRENLLAFVYHVRALEKQYPRMQGLIEIID